MFDSDGITPGSSVTGRSPRWFCTAISTVDSASTRPFAPAPSLSPHPDELHVVADGAVQPVTAHVDLGRRRQFQVHRVAGHRRRGRGSQPGAAGSRRAVRNSRSRCRAGQRSSLRTQLETLTGDAFDDLPDQSMLVPYCQRSPGSNSSGVVSAAIVAVMTLGWPCSSANLRS